MMNRLRPARRSRRGRALPPENLGGKYVWSQDAKVIAVQYAITAMGIGLVALVLSWLMRLQLGYPNSFSFINPATTFSLSPCTA